MLNEHQQTKHKINPEILAIKQLYFQQKKVIVEKYLKKPRVYNPELKGLMKGFFLGNTVSGVEQGEGLFFWNDGYAFEGTFELGKAHGHGLYGFVPADKTDVSTWRLSYLDRFLTLKN